jgi:membrane-associated phospholipid phosphatase
VTEPVRHTDDNLPSAIDRFDDVVDQWWGRTLRGRPRVDRLFYLASELGDFSLIWLIVGTAQGLRSDDDAAATGRLGATLLAESALVNQGIKRLVHRPRPLAAEPRPLHVRKPLTSSFPSGHSSSAVAAATLFSQRDPKLAPLYVALAAVVATSRVHVQVHHASDVVVGALVGAVIGQVVIRRWPLAARRRRR